MRRIDRFLFLAAALLISVYFFRLARPTLHAYFSPDDMMNLYSSWHPATAEVIKANLLFFTASPIYRPLANAWYRIVFHYAGFNPGPFHAFYLVLFGINLFLAYGMFRRLAGSREIAAVGTLLFSYHNRMDVLYMDTGYVYDALCFFFYFSVFLWYLRARQQKRAWNGWEMAASSVLYVCALNSKEMAATLPLMMLLYEWLYQRPRWSGLKVAGAWLVREGRGILLVGAITVVFAAGRVMGGDTIVTSPGYQMTLTWAQLMSTSGHHLGELFHDGVDWPAWGVVTLWSVLGAIAWLSRSPVLRYAWLFLMLTPLPIAFLFHRGPAQYYIPWFGWVLYAATLLVLIFERLTRRLPVSAFWLPRLRGAALVLGLVAILYPYNKRKGWENVSSIKIEAPIIRDVVEQLHGLYPRFRPGIRLLFLDDPIRVNVEDLLFMVRLSYADDSLMVDRVRKMPARPLDKEIATYDHVFDYKGGRFQEVSYPWRRSPTPMIVWTPAGPEVSHANWLPVTAADPAKPGEVLISKAIDLGATNPPVPDGKPFPPNPLLRIAAPAEVRVSGQKTETTVQIGWPEMVDTYRVDFVVPKSIPAGVVKIEISAAGVTGPAATIPVK
jgi:hypothetical protein